MADIVERFLGVATFDLVDCVRQEAALVEIPERARTPNTDELDRSQHDAAVDAIAAVMRAKLLAMQENLGRLTVSEAADAP